jgi:mono/diheme cytochrome c family protein
MKSLVLATAAALLAFAACGSPRRTEPIEGPFRGDGSEMRGRLVYAQNCHKCHPNGEAGLGPSLNEKPLPVFLMKIQVRRGLGAMPSFDEDQISPEQLDDLMEYVVAYRNHG